MFYFTNGKLIFQTCLQEIDMIFHFFFQTMYMAIVVYTPALALSQCKYQKMMYSRQHEFSYHLKSFFRNIDCR